MCGICGGLAFDEAGYTFRREDIERMRDTMAHRGPDGAGVWLAEDARVALGHRRLAIIDPTPEADQPMATADGRLHIVFNGEIYNHAEIRRELEATGRYRWRTDHSDTEVILHAFDAWGIDCLHRFRGMFAFALWDARNQEIWLVRDRVGIKPLYYSVHHGRVMFASEIKALLCDREQGRAVDHVALYHYLSFLTTPAPQTLFAGIRKVPGGTWIRIDRAGILTERRYWDPLDHVDPLVGDTDEEIAARVLEELRTSVKYRKVSDVPVGVFLSGGIDSSTNAALFSEGESDAVRTFTIGYQGEYQSYRNELEHARLMAERIGAKHHELLLEEDDLIEFLPRMIYLQDEPIADPVCVPVYYVSRLARDHGVVVCQVGEGADELFCGYDSWMRMLRVSRINGLPVPRFAKQAAAAFLARTGRTGGTRFELVRRAARGQPLFWGGAEAFTETQKRALLGPDLARELAALTSWDALAPIRARFDAKAWEPSNLNWMTYVDLNLRLPELLLMRVDKMSMGTSLEGRVPFLDHRFVELAMSIPSDVKIRGGEPKHILKRAVRGVIPDELIDRPKQGFGVPVYEWLQGRLGAEMRRELTAFARASGLLDHEEVERALDLPAGHQPWYLYNLALWWREFIA